MEILGRVDRKREEIYRQRLFSDGWMFVYISDEVVS